MEVYEAKYDYCDDCGDNLLSFKKGERFLITYKADGGWWAAQNLASNEIGYIPSAFVEVRISLCFLTLSARRLELLDFLEEVLGLFEIQIRNKSFVSVDAAGSVGRNN